MSARKIVHKVEPGMNIQEIEATTYQMRNFYRQFGDGFFSVLDTMNYIQHQIIVSWCKKNIHVLDVCCGRGLLLPLLRYNKKDIASYTGVDIERKNAIFLDKRVTDNKQIDNSSYYPFPVNFVEANVKEMSNFLPNDFFEIIVYTSAIEHMHYETGLQSLYECRKVHKKDGILILTCPNTKEDQDGYDTQYAAHVYEWKKSELQEGLKLAGYEIIAEWGLLIDKKILEIESEKLGILPLLKKVQRYVPSEWYIPVFAPLFPKQSKEIAYIAKAV